MTHRQYEDDEHEALWVAIHECARDAAWSSCDSPRDAAYEWLEITPLSIVVVNISDKLHELGYWIAKKAKVEVEK
jgi:hypothetical protein